MILYAIDSTGQLTTSFTEDNNGSFTLRVQTTKGWVDTGVKFDSKGNVEILYTGKEKFV